MDVSSWIQCECMPKGGEFGCKLMCRFSTDSRRRVEGGCKSKVMMSGCKLKDSVGM